MTAKGNKKKAPPKAETKPKKRAKSKANRANRKRKAADKAIAAMDASTASGENKMGRPTDYNPQLNEKAFKFCLLGLTDKEVAEQLSIGERTLYEWKVKYPDFAQAMANGKETADAEVAHGLYKRATGMTLPDCHVSNFKGKITVTNLVEHLAPDVKAGEIWLRNRASKKWNKTVDLGGAGVLGIIINENPKGQAA